MPILSKDTEGDLELSDAFTRLSVASFVNDVAVRPARFPRSWYVQTPGIRMMRRPGRTIGRRPFHSPKGFPAGTNVTILLTINNHGTIDANSVFVECNYYQTRRGPFDSSFATAVFNDVIANIPSRGQSTIMYNWRIPPIQGIYIDTFSLHVRVMDAFSLVYDYQTASLWDPKQNPRTSFKKFSREP